MANAQIEKLIKRHQAALERRESFRSLYQDAQDYGMPDRQIWTKPAEGQKRNNKLFDSTAQASVIGFANRLQNDLFPSGQMWSKLVPGPTIPDDKKSELEKEFELADKLSFAVIQGSNFDTAIHEFLMDLASGTAVMLPEDVSMDQPLMITTVPHSKVAIEEGAFGKISAVFFEMEIAARSVMDTWPDAKPDAKLKRIIQEKPEDKLKFINCAYKEGLHKWCYTVYNEKTKEVLVSRETKYKSNPFIVTRYMKVSGEVWGRGPLIMALPDIKTLNKMRELVLRHAAIRISGIWAMANDGVINTNNIKLTPGAIIPVAHAGGPNPSIANIAPQGDMQFAEIEGEKLEMKIKKFLLDQALPPETGPIRSATEIVQRVKELMKDAASPIGRINTEFVVPFRQRILDMLFERGLIKNRIVIDGMVTKVQLLGPLAQLQAVTEVENVVRVMQILSAFGPEIMNIAIKTEEVGSWIAEKMGVTTKLRRDELERKKLQDSMAQLINRQQQAQASPAGAGAAQGNSIPVA